MNTKRDTPPSNLRSLQARIDNEAAARNQPARRIRRSVTNVAVGQMLPPSVVKGGTAMKLRVGEPGIRFTPDFDASRSAEITLDNYIDQLADRLTDGWSGFTGTVEQEDAATPDGVPVEYVMQPFSIRLAFRGRHWLTVAFELGHERPDHVVQIIGARDAGIDSGTRVGPSDRAEAPRLHIRQPQDRPERPSTRPRRPTGPRTRRSDRHGRRRRNRQAAVRRARSTRLAAHSCPVRPMRGHLPRSGCWVGRHRQRHRRRQMG